MSVGVGLSRPADNLHRTGCFFSKNSTASARRLCRSQPYKPPQAKRGETRLVKSSIFSAMINCCKVTDTEGKSRVSKPHHLLSAFDQCRIYRYKTSPPACRDQVEPLEVLKVIAISFEASRTSINVVGTNGVDELQDIHRHRLGLQYILNTQVMGLSKSANNHELHTEYIHTCTVGPT